MIVRRSIAGIALVTLFGMPLHGAMLHVRPSDGVDGVRRAVALAVAGDTVVVHPGRYRGPVEIDRTLRVEGRGWPVLEGRGRGTVVRVTAPDVQIGGLLIRGSGDSLDEENSGIAVEAPGARVVGNRLDDVLFGIYLRRAPGSEIRTNEIVGKRLPLPRRGDAIRIWYSDDVVVADNRVQSSRDVVLWYSERLEVIGNLVRDGRYGLHFMYCDDATIRRNLILDNSVGAFLMYSRRLRLAGNTLSGSRGPSGYGVGLKDMDDAVVRGNLLSFNRVGIFLDNSPRSMQGRTTIAGNRLVANDYGVELMPNVRRTDFRGNGFEENGEQVAITGQGADPAANRWRGNYWSDYRGYDADRDGAGDVPYRADRLFEALADRSPELRLFRYGVVAGAIDLAARVLPVVRPVPKLTDEAPRMLPPRLDGIPRRPEQGSGGMMPLAAGLLAGAAALWTTPGRLIRRRPRAALEAAKATQAIEVRDASVRFGEVIALDRIDCSIAAGQAVALWGPNGAGKTTLLRALLGLVAIGGTLTVCGEDPRRRGKAVRRRIGFVPQEIAFEPGATVEETLRFFARLRRAAPGQVDELTTRLGLEAHAHKRVRELSGGLRQRLALAVALLADPQILLLDEPTASLDAAARREFIRLLSTVRGSRTLVFTSHRVEEVVALADRVLWLEGGRLRRDTEPQALFEDGGTVILRVLVAADDRRAAEVELRRFGEGVESIGPYRAIRISAARKAECLRALDQAGVLVRDFGIEANGRAPEGADGAL